jgi:hypothetical protein
MKKYIYILISMLSFNTCFALTDALKVRVTRANYSDETIVRFLQQGTTAYDNGFDALKLFSSNPAVPSLFTNIDPQTHLAINAQPVLTSTLTMDLNLSTTITGTFTLTALEIGSFTSNVSIMLREKSTGNIYNFRNGSIVTLNITANTVNTSGIFELVIAPPVMISNTGVTCFGGSNGTTSFQITGANGLNYELRDTVGILISSGAGLDNLVTVNGLHAGTYYLATSSSSTPTNIDTIHISEGIHVVNPCSGIVFNSR